jgi:hypothetical protein
MSDLETERDAAHRRSLRVSDETLDYWEVASSLSIASYSHVAPSIPTCSYSLAEDVDRSIAARTEVMR